MHKIFTLFKREYRAAVRTKSFIISLLLVPIMMGGGFAAVIIMENKEDTDDKHFTVIDRTGELEELLQEAVENRNNKDIIHSRSGEQTDPAFVVEFVELRSTGFSRAATCSVRPGKIGRTACFY